MEFRYRLIKSDRIIADYTAASATEIFAAALPLARNGTIEAVYIHSPGGARKVSADGIIQGAGVRRITL
ncbi:MAG: hypothetical protein WC613_00015 [Candidatus Aenigmatarchaeota archaeon]